MARRNLPHRGFVTMARSREVFSRFFEIERELTPAIESAGGRLRVGLYTRRTPDDRTEERLREVVEGYRRYPFLAEEFPLAASFFDTLLPGPSGPIAAFLEHRVPLLDARRREPQLHRKTQFFATRESLLALSELVATERSLRGAFSRAAQGGPLSSDEVARLGPEHAWLDGELAEAHARLPKDVAARAVYYLTVGSLNKDTRGQVLDGEALFVVAGAESLVAYTDFAALLASTTWIDSHEQLDKLLPPVTHLKRQISRWVRKTV
jgi:hypothetical protein